MSFFWIRLLVGVGEASCAPAANSLIGDLFPSEKRARALGIFMLGLPLGLLLAFSIVGVLAQNYGWRVPFYLAAIPGFVVAVMMLFAAEPVRGSQETYAIDATTALDRPMRRILAIPTVWWIIASGATVNFAAYAMGTFLPTMLIRYHGLSIGKAGLIAAIVLGATGLVGLVAGGWLADYLHKKFLRGRLLLASCSMLALHPCSTSDLRSRPVRPMPRRFCYRWAGYSTSATIAAFIPHCRMSSNPGCGSPQWPYISSFNMSSGRVSAPLSPARCRTCTPGRR
jgi:predicted MFS family arabinose efflux permease